jgi:hypothetical protein
MLGLLSRQRAILVNIEGKRMSGTVAAICICPIAGGAMQQVSEVEAIAGRGLQGDRYATGEGSFNKGNLGLRQVTLISDQFFSESGFEPIDSRRNIVTQGVELLPLIGRTFWVGEAQLRGIKYCTPCERPNNLAGKERSFKQAFSDRGGLIAAVVESGRIQVGSAIVIPSKG